MFRAKPHTLVFLFIIFSSSEAFSSTFYPKDHIVIDLSKKIEWLRCSVGLQWNGKTCVGKTLLMDHDTIKQAILIADEQLGPSWRLPTLDELYSLVCKKCEKGKKFDKVVFPNTDPRAYWTGQKNLMSKGSYWTVNFFTGHKFGRFYPEQQMAVRLVRDR
jgi:hypothetical protein